MLPFAQPFRPDRIGGSMSAKARASTQQLQPIGSIRRGNNNHAKETQMAENNPGRRWLYAAGFAALLAALTALAPPAGAQDAPKIGETSGGPATAVDLATPPALPAVPPPAGVTIHRTPPPARAPP